MFDNLIIFGQCSNLYLYLFGSFICKVIETILLGDKIIIDDNKEGEIYSIYGFVPVLKDFQIMQSIYSYFGNIIFGLIFLFILKDRTKKKTNENFENAFIPRPTVLSFVETNNNKFALTYSLYFKILSITFLYIVHSEIKKALYLNGFQCFNIWTFDIFFMYIFIRKFFMKKFFLHQQCSMLFVMITSSIFIILSEFCPFSKKNKEEIRGVDIVDHKYIILLVLSFLILSGIYSFSRVYLKVLLDFKYASKFFIIIIIGSVGFVLMIPISFILSYCGYPEKIQEYFKTLNEKDNYQKYFEIFFVTPLYIFISFLELNFELLTIYYLNPLYILITNNLCYGIVDTIKYIITVNTYGDAVFLQHYICIIFSELFAMFGYSIYLELIIFNFCGMSTNIRGKIIERGDNEVTEFGLDTQSDTVSIDDIYELNALY